MEVHDTQRARHTILGFRKEAQNHVAWLIHLIRKRDELIRKWGRSAYRYSLEKAYARSRESFTLISRFIRVSAEVRFDRLSNPNKVVEPIPWKKLFLHHDGLKQPLVNSTVVEEDEFDADQ